VDNVFEITEQKPSAAISSMRPVLWQSQRISVSLKPNFEKTVKNKTVLQPGIELFNIAFNVRQGDEYVFVESPQWHSLQSYGKTAREAIENMLAMIRDLVQEYIFVGEAELSGDAIEFRKFLIQKLLV
jgi:hypothetical protein